ncbi:MAG TPA: HEPN domain-containing protein [Chitinophagaceae bacterium]|nr:HEPN domain-containing protein [Chitinophagaceae bacterium]
MTEREQAIQLKIEKAKKIMAEVDILIEKKLYNTTITRLYYSCFEVTKALLLTKDLTPKTHRGVATLLHKHFVEENLFAKDKAAFFGSLMDERNDADYGDFYIMDYETIAPLISRRKNTLVM